LKQALRKFDLTKENIKLAMQKFLFHYRITPILGLKSPAERMFGRKLRSRLDLIFPKEIKIEVGSSKSDREIRNFKVGDTIAVREYLNKKIKWCFGTVIKKVGKLHYIIKLENGKIWKRHINQLRANSQEYKEDRLPIDCMASTEHNRPYQNVPEERERPGNVPIEEHAGPAISTEREREENAQSQMCENKTQENETCGSNKDLNVRPQRARKKPFRYGDPLS